MYEYWTIVGNIGACKSQFLKFLKGEHSRFKLVDREIVNELSRQERISVLEEAVHRSPESLRDFYTQLKSAKTEIEIEKKFLDLRVANQEILLGLKGVAVEERPVWEGAEFFVPALYNEKKLTEQDLREYYGALELVLHKVQQPTVIVYFRNTDVDSLKRRIDNDSTRSVDKDMSIEHLIALNEQYESKLHNPDGRKEWFEKYGFRDIPVVEIDTSGDYNGNDSFMQDIFDRILDARLKMRKMKIGFVGTHGIGKTYLTKRLTTELLGRGISADDVKEVARNLPRGFEVNKFTTRDIQEYILYKQICEETESIKNYLATCTDRSFIDNYSYYVRKFGRNTLLENVIHYQLLTKPYDSLIHVPITTQVIEDDKFRDSKDMLFYRDIDAITDFLIKDVFMQTLKLTGAQYYKLEPALLENNIHPKNEPRSRDPWVYFCLDKVLEKYNTQQNYLEYLRKNQEVEKKCLKCLK